MVEHWKAEGEKALVKVSHCLLDKLFDEGASPLLPLPCLFFLVPVVLLAHVDVC